MSLDAGSELTPADGDQASTSEETRALQRRYMKVVVIALIAWPAFAVIDWLISRYLAPVGYGRHIGLRLVGVVALVIAFFYGRRPRTANAMLAGDILVCTTMAIIIAVQGALSGGLGSPLILVLIVVLLFRSLAAADHWRRGLWPIGMLVVAELAALVIVALTVPSRAAELRQPAVQALALFHQFVLISAAAIALVGGHIMWTLRQQVYRARALGRYRLLRRLGAGGMGEVWLAHHRALKHDVAIKVLRPKPGASVTAAARFEREARATAELSHPNVVRVFDFGVTDDGLWYYAMEFIEGADLRRLVKERGALDALEACGLVAQAARGLGEAHCRGVIHRDVKPDNLMVTTLGDGSRLVKVVDFGLARLAGDGTDDLTTTGIAIGTPLWVAPEVVRGDDADARTDVYGLGAVLFFTLCGVPPFRGKDTTATLAAHLSEPPRSPSSLVAGIPPALDDIVQCCLAKDPARRFASGRELAAALDRLIAEAQRPA